MTTITRAVAGIHRRDAAAAANLEYDLALVDFIADVPAFNPAGTSFVAIKRNGEEISFKSSLTQEQLRQGLHILKNSANNVFAASLLRNVDNLSPKQESWAHYIVNDYIKSQTQSANDSASEFEAIFAAFDAAKSKGAKRLKFRMQDCILSPSQDGDNVWVNDPHNTTENRWGSLSPAYLGKINRRGGLLGNFTAAVRQQIAAAAANPAAAAAEYGRETGYCSFCSRELTDERSVGVGYGPICAGKYSLPWG
jgi:hypothetical protein